MVKWRFWQKDQPTDGSELPEEVKEYYESTQQENRGAAWALAGATLVVTVILALGLFFAGRAVYRQFTDDTVPTEEIAQETNSDSGAEEGTQPSDEAQDSQSESETETNGGDEQVAPNEAGDEQIGGFSDDLEETDETPATGASELPDSGPGDVLAIFVATSLVSAVVYHKLAPRFSKN